MLSRRKGGQTCQVFNHATYYFEFRYVNTLSDILNNAVMYYLNTVLPLSIKDHVVLNHKSERAKLCQDKELRRSGK